MKLLTALFLAAGMFPFVAAVFAAKAPDFTDSELELPVYRLLRDLHEFGVRNRMLNVPPRDGRMLQMLVLMNGATSALEVGTSDGVSAIWIALGLSETGGRLTTLEIDSERAALARKHFEQAGVSELVTLIEGDALEKLPALEGEYDFVFLDAAKQQYKQYLEAVWNKLKPGAVIVAHNAIQQSHMMADYLEFVQNNPELSTVILNTGQDGIALSYRK